MLFWIDLASPFRWDETLSQVLGTEDVTSSGRQPYGPKNGGVVHKVSLRGCWTSEGLTGISVGVSVSERISFVRTNYLVVDRMCEKRQGNHGFYNFSFKFIFSIIQKGGGIKFRENLYNICVCVVR